MYLYDVSTAILSFPVAASILARQKSGFRSRHKKSKKLLVLKIRIGLNKAGKYEQRIKIHIGAKIICSQNQLAKRKLNLNFYFLVVHLLPK